MYIYMCIIDWKRPVWLSAWHVKYKISICPAHNIST